MSYQHKSMAEGRWQELTFLEQMANIGGEIERAVRWKKKGNPAYSRMALERGLELLDLSLGDRRNRKRFREIARVREALVDHFAGENVYQSTDESWCRYFLPFTFAARKSR